MAVVCSARSSNTKSEGTTNRLLQAYRHCLKGSPDRFKTLVQRLRTDHIEAAQGYLKSPKLATRLVREVDDECTQTLLLLEATRTIGHGTSHIRDKVTSAGERLACRFVCAVLRDQGVSSEMVNFADVVPPGASEAINQAFYDEVSAAMAARVAACEAAVPVVTGFYGPVEGGLLTEIGRGYTDMCASLLAIGLQAHEFQVWKEVEGIFTADPRKVPTAKMLPVVSSEEASELTFHGSEVVHFTAMRLAMRNKIPMRIKNVMSPKDAGTLILNDYTDLDLAPLPDLEFRGSRRSSETSVDDLPCAPLAITSKDQILLINIRSAERVKPHTFFAGIFSVLDRYNLSIDLICTSEVQVSLALHSEVSLITGDDEDDSEIKRRDLKSAIAQLQEYGRVELLPSMAVVSVVGKQMKRASGVAGKLFTVLGQNNINVEMITQGMSWSRMAVKQS